MDILNDADGDDGDEYVVAEVDSELFIERVTVEIPAGEGPVDDTNGNCGGVILIGEGGILS